jgi:hypothetical protein
MVCSYEKKRIQKVFLLMSLSSSLRACLFAEMVSSAMDMESTVLATEITKLYRVSKLQSQSEFLFAKVLSSAIDIESATQPTEISKLYRARKPQCQRVFSFVKVVSSAMNTEIATLTIEIQWKVPRNRT